MKRLYIALLLLAAVVIACVLTHCYQHRQLDRMLKQLDHIEHTVYAGDIPRATQLAQDFSTAYRQVSNRIRCYIAHGELAESCEIATLLPTLVQTNNPNDLLTNLERLRIQLLYLQQVDDPLPWNIL